jgi:hypothetical protein
MLKNTYFKITPPHFWRTYAKNLSNPNAINNKNLSG